MLVHVSIVVFTGISGCIPFKSDVFFRALYQNDVSMHHSMTHGQSKEEPPAGFVFPVAPYYMLSSCCGRGCG